MIVEIVSVKAISPAPWNVRTGHDVEGIADSIRTNGFRDPIEVWRATGEIVAGEGRYRAATEFLGLTEVPVIYQDFTSEADAKRYAIAANRTGDKSSFAEDALFDQLADLGSLAGTGFAEGDFPELDALLDPPDPLGGMEAFAGGGEELEDAQEGATRPNAGEERFPLGIVLTGPERKRWEAYKETIGQTRDKPAFLALLDGAEE